MFRLPPEFEFLQGKLLSSRVYPEFFSFPKQSRVLNAGFGDGPQALVYAQAFGSMTGIEYQPGRVERAQRLMSAMGLGERVRILEGNVEAMPVTDASFDIAFAIDIIEHVEHPEVFLKELYRTLVPGGRLLITFPAMHDRFQDTMGVIGKWLKPWKKREPEPTTWHPDHHQREYPVAVWSKMTEAAGFRVVRSRATTMFPPLHLYGIPRFWFSNSLLHRIDRWFASRPHLQRFGQTVMVECVKPIAPEEIYYITNVRFPTEKAHGWQIAKMCEAFRELGHPVTLVVPDRQTPIAQPAEVFYDIKKPFSIIRLPIFDAFAVAWLSRRIAFIFTEWSWQRAVRRWLRQTSLKTAFVMTRDQFLVPSLAGRGGRLAFEAHDISPSFFWLHRRIGRLVDLIIATNAWKRDQLVKRWGPLVTEKNCVSLPNGIDVSAYASLPSRETARQQLGWESEKRYVVYTGHLYAWKGVFVLAEAAARLSEDVRVVMLGGTPEDTAMMQTFLKEKNIQRVSLVAHVPHEQVALYLAGADALVLPNSGKSWNSRYTTSPIKLWEYLAARKPVVVSDLPSLRELVTEREVFFAPPDDPAALAETIKQALQGDAGRVEAGWHLVQQQSWVLRATKIRDLLAGL